MKLDRIVAYLDRTLKIDQFDDASHNGLQVENSGAIRKIAVGVDASMEFFEMASAAGADLLICHHGLSWGDSLKRITAMNYRRLKFLLAENMALYACHLPLDAHPRLGNNARICRALGLRALKPFGRYHGQTIGFRGAFERGIDIEQFTARVERLFGQEPDLMAFGKPRVRTVAVVSGGGSDLLDEAVEVGADVFLSGEPKLSAYHVAREAGIHAVFAGHYATETFGVRAVAQELARRFGVPAEFLDTGVPF